ncbi:transmembrane protein 243b isoform X1 [Salvelinus namaycush]|uniref:Transmembrane protein 243b isoform X1 n=1 Tax=Salvelinus namaycush TaxID=8040 RepID=A0A8U0QCC2_SALNM|nr:transmembrane protein 243b isoform X1 [Salvelinus namaycush]
MDDFTTNDFTTRTYGTSGLDNRLLFGETSARDRAVNLVVGGLTSLLVAVTVISSFVFPSLPPWPLNVFLAFCILLTCGSAMVLIVWYRQGDLVLGTGRGWAESLSLPPVDCLVPAGGLGVRYRQGLG